VPACVGLESGPPGGKNGVFIWRKIAAYNGAPKKGGKKHEINGGFVAKTRGSDKKRGGK